MRMLHRVPSGRLRFLSCIATVLLSSSAQGVVIDSGDGTGNTTPPADDFGFENVGNAQGLGGIYLGDGWVLTANHVGARPITLLGVTYQPVPGSGVRLTNTSGPPPDLYVYRINGFPALSPVVLSSATPSVGETVSCTGHGWTRQSTTTTWDINWVEQPPTVYTGFKPGSPATRRWGGNAVSDWGFNVLDTRAFEVVFDDVGGVTDELQAVVGDSGGGCFAKRSGTWELVGVLFAMSVYGDPNGPSLPPPAQPVNTAVFGNATYSADVAFYRTQIEALTPPLGQVPALPAVGVGALAALLVLASRGLRASRLCSASPTRR